MRYIEVSSRLRLRPSHVLLMIYRYVSGIYQTGDLSALNYLMGFIKGKRLASPKRVLTVAGHGIGEAEIWLAEHLKGCQIDVTSFSLLDTQLMHFLRAAHASDIEVLFEKFKGLVAPYEVLNELVADPGLIPYWCEQAEEFSGLFERYPTRLFSDAALSALPADEYDLIYVSQCARDLSVEAVESLRHSLSPQGVLGVLMPIREQRDQAHLQPTCFANSMPFVKARERFRQQLETRGYTLLPAYPLHVDLSHLTDHCEKIRFNVLATAHAILVGELILSSVYEHITDRARLDVLNDVVIKFRDVQIPMSEELQFCVVEGKS
jgi:hypothetical protein